MDCIISRKLPKTDGHSGLRVPKILETCQESLKGNGKISRFAIEKRRNISSIKTSSNWLDGIFI